MTDGALEGERLRDKAVSAGADWMVLTPDGTGIVDVRFTLATDDGALVYIQYDGRMDVTGGPGSASLYVAPRFETGDARYAWLNKVQAVGKGTFDPETNVVLYEWYEVR